MIWRRSKTKKEEPETERRCIDIRREAIFDIESKVPKRYWGYTLYIHDYHDGLIGYETQFDPNSDNQYIIYVSVSTDAVDSYGAMLLKDTMILHSLLPYITSIDVMHYDGHAFDTILVYPTYMGDINDGNRTERKERNVGRCWPARCVHHNGVCCGLGGYDCGGLLHGCYIR